MGECKENLQNDKETNTKRASDIPALILILKKEMENTDTVDATLQQIQNTNNNKGKKENIILCSINTVFLKITKTGEAILLLLLQIIIVIIIITLLCNVHLVSLHSVGKLN